MSRAADSNAGANNNEAPTKEWKFTQWFKKMPTLGMQPDADVLSAVSFDKHGKFLATGDRGGRIVVLEADPVAGKTKPGGIHYKFHVEFQSHEAEFDYVRSFAIEERISKIKWLPPSNDALFLLSTNDRAIKLWKIHRKANEAITHSNVDKETGRGPSSISQLKMPEVEQVADSTVVATLRRGYAVDVHQFHINSLAVNVDGETFLSADNLRINLWNANVADKAFNIIDTKPANMQDLTEVITVADFDPTSCNQFLYATSKGIVRLGDLREAALLDKGTRVFATPPPTGSTTSTGNGSATTPGASPSGTASGGGGDKSFFSDVTLSISDAKFTPDGTQIITRDFMNLKVYDVRKEKQPLETISVHEYLRPKLWDLYENDCVYDGFEVGVSAEGNLATGSYNNYFHIYDLKTNKTDTWAEASKLPMGVYPISHLIWSAQARNSLKKKRNSRTGRTFFSKKPKSPPGGKDVNPPIDPSDPLAVLYSPNLPPLVNPDTLDYRAKVLHVQFHPKINAVAVAGLNNLFFYAETGGNKVVS
jgi:serine/threonine-protein phosphatase 2A regulatory subunit B